MNLRAYARAIAASVLLVLAFGLTTAPPAQAATYPVAPYTSSNVGFMNNIRYYVNQQRHSHGLQTVYPDYCALWHASHWNWHLAYTGLFYHQNLYPILSTCHRTLAGEVLARGYVSSLGVVTGWMNSPEHRAILLDGRYNSIGVDARYANGAWTYTAEFLR